MVMYEKQLLSLLVFVSVRAFTHRTKTVCVIDVRVDLTLGLRPVLLDQAVSTASVSESVSNCCYLSF